MPKQVPSFFLSLRAPCSSAVPNSLQIYSNSLLTNMPWESTCNVAIDARIHFDTRARSRVVQSADILGTYNTVALLMTRTKATTSAADSPGCG
ncbi:hypothetical protein CPAR01_02322 [Colletotrichum paranaense]|uniref:Uncharacterized protein n=1 Tax=Colletotrichum paranaense TaxID=1914294 RepID=A0ABQ9SZS3_9PEZI|nr:uncharacterized protein CPAR01_02322 [Colletotrichum paranaense]KAK1544820.1 hypothetical protein CPAR01_02322 [Colletotrichum paranaense]